MFRMRSNSVETKGENNKRRIKTDVGISLNKLMDMSIKEKFKVTIN
jgi:hypothetical protein